jgi:hypothetical protein
MTLLKHKLMLLSCGAALVVSLSACSITETINNILSSTSGRSWFTEDGQVKADHRVQAFMAFNFENIKQDMAKGQGEYLDSLSTLMEIPPDRRASFYAHAQSRYPFVVEHHSSPLETLVQLVGQDTAATIWR